MRSTEVARYRELVKKDAAAQVEVDHWVYERQAAEAQLLGAEAQVVIAKLNLGYTEVTAPFDGQMGKALIDPGNVVGAPGQQAALAEITQLDPIYVVANLSQQDVLKIRANLDQQRLSLADLHKVPVEVGLPDESRFPHPRHDRICLAGDRSGDRNDAGARRAGEPEPRPAARVFRPHAPADGSVRHATRCWSRTGHCRKIRAAAIVLDRQHAIMSSRSAMSSSAKPSAACARSPRGWRQMIASSSANCGAPLRARKSCRN